MPMTEDDIEKFNTNLFNNMLLKFNHVLIERILVNTDISKETFDKFMRGEHKFNVNDLLTINESILHLLIEDISKRTLTQLNELITDHEMTTTEISKETEIPEEAILDVLHGRIPYFEKEEHSAKLEEFYYFMLS